MKLIFLYVPDFICGSHCLPKVISVIFFFFENTLFHSLTLQA